MRTLITIAILAWDRFTLAYDKRMRQRAALLLAKRRAALLDRMDVIEVVLRDELANTQVPRRRVAIYGKLFEITNIRRQMRK